MKKLTNTKMGRVVAHLLKKEDLSLKDGKVQLTDEERATVKKTFGEDFLKKLENTIFDDSASAENCTALYDAAVANEKVNLQKENETLQAANAQLQATVNSLIDEPESAPAAQSVEQPKTSGQFKINMNATHNVMALAAAKGQLAAATGVDIADIKAEFKTVLPEGARLEILTQRIYQGFPDSQYMTRVLCHGRDHVGASAIMSEVSQQFTNKWTPKGTAKFTPVETKYRRHKINVAIDPTSVIDSWLVDLYEQGKSPAEQPLVLYIINEHILPKVADDITNVMAGKGKYVAHTPSQAGEAGSAAIDSMDGYETILVEGKKNAECKMNFYKKAVDVRTLKGKALLDYVDDFSGAISPLFANNMPIYCSEQFLRAYKQADFAEYGKYTGEAIGNTVRFGTFTLVALKSMHDSAIIFATPKRNFIELVDLSPASSCINDIQKVDYEVRVYGEYSFSVGFEIQEAVFASVPDTYVPSSTTAEYNADAWANGASPEAASASEVNTQEGI